MGLKFNLSKACFLQLTVEPKKNTIIFINFLFLLPPLASMRISKFASFSFFFHMLFIYLLSPENSQVVETCSASTDCGPGFYCGHCPGIGRTQSVCTRGQATVVTSIVSVSDSISCFFCFDYETQTQTPDITCCVRSDRHQTHL